MFKLKNIYAMTLIFFLIPNSYALNNKQNADLIITKDVKHDLSLPLRDMQAKDDIIKHKYMMPIKKIISEKTFSLNMTHVAPLLPLVGFEGIGVGLNNYTVTEIQPDLNAGVGLTQYFEFATPDIAVFNKSGQLLPGFPKSAKSLWAGFGGTCENFATGRITIKYDQLVSRWVVSQLASENQTTGPFFYCVGVSTSDDATGNYHRYAYQLDSFSSYGELALWTDAYYLGLNMVGRLSFGPRICALERDKMLIGDTATMQCTQLTHTESQPLMPVNFLGQTLPPIKTPGYFLAVNNLSTIDIYKFYVDFANPQNTTISAIELPVDPYKQVCQDTNGVACAIQPNTDNRLDLLSDRFLTRIVYRQFVGGYGSLVGAHVVEGPQPKFTPAVRWYEFRIYDNQPTRNPIIHQQATIAPDSMNRFAPSINIDTFGNIAVGYTVSSSKVHPSPELSWRSVTDPLNTMTIQPLYTGLGSQINGVTPWTRVTKLVTDPTNRCTMFYTGEYLKNSGSMNWSTFVIRFNLPGCV